jgi:hypothetical protein
MTTRTRNFAIGSLLVLAAGLGTAAIAYFGLPISALTAASGPDELKFLPGNSTLVAFADVHEVMTSELRQTLRGALPFNGRGQRTFQDETGINIETDIDRVVFALTPNDASDRPDSSGLVIARGRFDAVRIENAMRDRGAQVDEYKGKRILTVSERANTSATSPQPSPDTSTGTAPVRRDSLSLSFVEPGLVVVGSTPLIRQAIDLQGGGESVLSNDNVMSRIKGLEAGNVWAVGRFDTLTLRANLTPGMAGQLPAITWFAASGQVDSGLRASVKAETRDEASANGLRDIVRGFIAFARMQAGSRPDLQPLLDTIQLGGNGPMVTLSLDLSPQLLETLTNSLRRTTPALPR